MSARTVVEQVGAFLCQNDGHLLDEGDPQKLYVMTSFATDTDELGVLILDHDGFQVACYTAILQEVT